MNILLTTLNSKFIHSNLAIRYLNEACGQNKKYIDLREFTINNSEDYILMELIAGNYDVVCFSCYIWNVDKILHLTKNLKKAKRDVIICLGGPEVSYDAEAIMRENGHVDMILVGEGEESFPLVVGKLVELEAEAEAEGGLDSGFEVEAEGGFGSGFEVEAEAEGGMEIGAEAEGGLGANSRDRIGRILEDLDIDGVCYGKGSEIVMKPQQKLVDMSKVGFVYGEGFARDKVVYYEGTRGCPYNCSYCMSSIDKTVRGLPLDRLKREMLFFLENDAKQVKFLDRTFNWNKERADEIFRFLIENDNGITNFHFEICGDNLTENTFKILENARPGLFQFEIGIQSTYQKTLDAVNRSSNNQKLLENIRKIVKMGNIHTHVDLIAGLPYESYERFGQSFDDVYNLDADQLQLGFLKLLKGTLVRAEADCHGFVFDDRPPYQVIGNKYISPMEIARLKQIENMVDIYLNKGGYGGALKALVEVYGRPFEFFEAFSEFYYREGFQHRSLKKEDQYRVLNKFVENVVAKRSEGAEAGTDEVAEAAEAAEAVVSDLEGAGRCDLADRLKGIIYEDLKATMNFDAVKKFDRKGWEING